MIKNASQERQDGSMDLNQIHTALSNRLNFNYKFKDVPVTQPPSTDLQHGIDPTRASATGDVLHPGWAEPTFQSFSKRMVDKPVLLNHSEYIRLTSLQHDLDMYDSVVELESQRGTYDYEAREVLQYNKLGGSLPLTDEEIPFRPKRKQFLVIPFQAKSILYKNYLDENIIRQDFLEEWCGYVAELTGASVQRQALFAIEGVFPPRGQGSGLGMNNGILQQLLFVTKENRLKHRGEYGFSEIIPMKNIVYGIQRAVQQFIDNNGNINDAIIILPPQVYARMTSEVANMRLTGLGDIILQTGDLYTIQGIPIVIDPVLRETRNGWNVHYFRQDGTIVVGDPGPRDIRYTKLLYGFITAKKNIKLGVMNDIEMMSEWDLDIIGWKIAILLKMDYTFLWDQDTMAIPFSMDPFIDEQAIPYGPTDTDYPKPPHQFIFGLRPEFFYNSFMEAYHKFAPVVFNLKDWEKLSSKKKSNLEQAIFNREEEVTYKKMCDNEGAKKHPPSILVRAHVEMVESYGPDWKNAPIEEIQQEIIDGKLHDAVQITTKLGKLTNTETEVPYIPLSGGQYPGQDKYAWCKEMHDIQFNRINVESDFKA